MKRKTAIILALLVIFALFMWVSSGNDTGDNSEDVNLPVIEETDAPSTDSPDPQDEEATPAPAEALQNSERGERPC